MKRILIAILLVGMAAADDKKASVLLQAGLAKETVQGDLKAAIDLYAKAAKEAGANRALAAKALLHLGQCHEKLGDAQARGAYERIVREFGDQREAGEARTRLAALGGGRVSSPSRLSVRQITTLSDNDAGPYQLSPDGRSVLVTDWGKGDVAVVDLATGEKRLVTRDANDSDGADYSAWSPDGRQIAYGWWTKDNWQLKVIGVDGSGERVVHQTGAEVRFVEPYGWSPDGQKILVRIDRKDQTMLIVWATVADGSLQVVKTRPENMHRFLSLSPDGRFIAYEVQQGAKSDISLIASDGSRDVAIIQHPAHDSLVGWTPDGKRLLFTSDRTGNTTLWAIAIEDGKPLGEPELIRRDLVGQEIYSLGVARNGALYYSVHVRPASDIYVATLDQATGKVLSPVQPLKGIRSGSNILAKWSPDGKRLFYLFMPPAGTAGRLPELWTMDAASGTNREIQTNLNLVVGSGRWSPDSRSILLHAVSDGGQASVYKVDVETGTSEAVRPPSLPAAAVRANPAAGNTFLTWSTDLSKFAAIRQGALVVGTTGTEPLATLYQGRFPFEILSVAISPDGRQIAAAMKRPEGTHVVRVFAASGEMRELVRSPGNIKTGWGIAWSPDGRHIFYSAYAGQIYDGNYSIWRVPAAGGEAVNTGISMRDLREISVHPDGRQILFSAGNLSRRQTWVMENFLPAATAKPVAPLR